MRERNRLDSAIGAVRGISEELEATLEIAELADAEGDSDMLDEAAEALAKLSKRAAEAELEALLSGEADANNAFVEIHAGAGGTESQDWANMLLRMYLRWAQSRGFSTELIEENSGEGGSVGPVLGERKRQADDDQIEQQDDDKPGNQNDGVGSGAPPSDDG